jgi:D-alanyl-D-alanine carboxypeptidase/D-alanyl-D-alanine-endopeptidase (penicillin-binding protein 4)
MARGPFAWMDATPLRRAIPAAVAVSVLGALVSASAAQVVGERAGDARPARNPRSVPAPVVTPLVSVRRVASAVTGWEAVSRVQRGVATLTTALPESACFVVEVHGRRAVDLRAGTALEPASNAKLAVAHAALARLGADHRFTTTVLGDVRAGAVEGDLWLVGGGDPVLVTAPFRAREKYRTRFATPLEALADTVVAAGVRSVSGMVRGDGSRYDAERFAPGLPDGIRVVEVGPIGALLVNDGAVATSPLKPADPAAAAAETFALLLAERGVRVAGGSGAGTTPNGGAGLATVAEIRSAPLGDLVRDLLTNSDNDTAEMLLKEVGRAATGEGTRAAGIADALSQVGAAGVPVAGLALSDGAGLHRDDRMSCDTAIGILDAAPPDGPLRSGLAVAARTGTLRDVEWPPAVGGTLRAKTGTLVGVKSLSGVYPTAAGGDATFSLMLNGPGSSTVDVWGPLWTTLGLALDDASAVPAPVLLTPVSRRG